MARPWFVALTGLGVPSMLLAQSTLRGRVIDDSTRSPIQGVEVLVEGSDLKSLTGADGRFILSGITYKAQYALLRKIGYRPVKLRLVAFGAKDTIDVDATMSPAVLELPPLEVTVSAVPPGMEDFGERRALGFGAFIDWTVLRRSEDRRLSDLLLRTSGLRLLPMAGNKLVAVTARGSFATLSMNEKYNSRCPMAVWLDGVLLYEPVAAGSPKRPEISVDDYTIANLEAIEIYNPAQVPSRFRSVSSGCGALVMWSRRR